MLESTLKLDLGRSSDGQVSFTARRGTGTLKIVDLDITMTHKHWEDMGQPTQIFATIEEA